MSQRSPPGGGGVTTTSKVSRWDEHGREHIVHVRKSGMQRQLTCDTCGWRKGAQFLPWLKAEEHLNRSRRAPG
ncbi:hypothetical protein [Streptomyces sp. NPDC057428]|uniref:hypothetical protein n=1 Tax=Streptomyces sp. NPDC057428 TaxID=3346129 RepID=UPI0036D1C4AA